MYPQYRPQRVPVMGSITYQNTSNEPQALYMTEARYNPHMNSLCTLNIDGFHHVCEKKILKPHKAKEFIFPGQYGTLILADPHYYINLAVISGHAYTSRDMLTKGIFYPIG